MKLLMKTSMKSIIYLSIASIMLIQGTATNPLHIHELIRFQLNAPYYPKLCSICFGHKYLLQHLAQPVHTPADVSLIFIECLTPWYGWIVGEIKLPKKILNNENRQHGRKILK